MRHVEHFGQRRAVTSSRPRTWQPRRHHPDLSLVHMPTLWRPQRLPSVPLTIMRELTVCGWTFGWDGTGEPYVTVGARGRVIVAELDRFNAYRTRIFAELRRRAAAYGPLPAGQIVTLEFGP